MALWMEKGAEPQTESERADLDAIAALKESAAIELKVLSFLSTTKQLCYSSVFFVFIVVLGVCRRRAMSL